MTSLQDKIAALKAGDYDVVFEGTPYMMRGHASAYCTQNAAKVIVLEEQVRVLREALVAYNEATDNTTYPEEHPIWGAKKLSRTALAATDMGE